MPELSYLGFKPAHYSPLVASIPAGAYRTLDVRVLAEELRRLCKTHDLNIGLMWSQIMHETASFSSDVWRSRCNPAGIKNKSGDAYMRYPNGVDAARAMVSHVASYLFSAKYKSAIDPELDPRWEIAARIASNTNAEDRPLLDTIAKSWAEDASYARKVGLWFIRLFVIEDAVSLPVLLTAGHHNLSGGNPVETGATDDLARAYLARFRTEGVRCEWWQQIDGDNDPDDSLTGLAGVAVGANNWLGRQPNGGILLDLHFEGGGSPGIFCVYPDWAGDVNPKDRAWAVEISAEIATRVGLSVRSAGCTEPGAMSERQTGVGGQGYRLGMFGLTAGQRERSIRLVIEHGSHDQDPDRTRIFRDLPAYAASCAAAAVAEIIKLQRGA